MPGDFDLPRFLRAVQDRTGLTLDQARIAVDTTFEAIGRAVPPTIATDIAALLPKPLATAVERGAASPSDDDVIHDVAHHEHVTLGAAKEHAQVVLEQLAAHCDERTRDRLAELLPEPADAWLVPWQPPPQRRPQPPAGRTQTLADGRPGSATPLSEAGPDRGHHDSPARTTDPHADTRLSSTHGVSTERDHTSIAEGRPGSQHPVSEGHD